MSLRSLLSQMNDVINIDQEVSLAEVSKILYANERVPVHFSSLEGWEAIGNLWSSRERISSALNIRKEELIGKILQALAKPMVPEPMERAPFLEEIKTDFDLTELPIPQYFPQDGGRYITSGVAVAEWEGKRNLSFHRLMLLDKRRFAIRLVPRHLYTMHKLSSEQGKDLPVAFCVGLCPSVLLAGATSTNYRQDEMEIASSLHHACLGSPIQVTRLRSGLSVPTQSELVFEGRLTSETSEEGPFLDITGTYDKKRIQPIFEVDRLYMRRKPLFHLLLPGGLEHYMLMGLPREPIIYRTVNQVVPRVHGVRLTEGGCCWLHGVVSITKNKEGDGVNAIMAAFSGHPSMKKVTIVDEDIDIFDDRQVEWAEATRFQASRSLLVMNNAAGSSLDPSSDGMTSKVGIDATKPFGEKGFQRIVP